MRQTLEIPLRFTNNRIADIAIDENDPLQMLLETEELEEDLFTRLSGYPSRSAYCSAWIGRIYGNRYDE